MGDSGLFSADTLRFDFEETSVRDDDGKVVGFSEQAGHHSMLTVSDTSGRLGWQIWDTGRRTYGYDWTVHGPDWDGGRFGKPRRTGYFIGDRLIATEHAITDLGPGPEFDVYDVENVWIARVDVLPKRDPWRNFLGRSYRWQVHFLTPVDRPIRPVDRPLRALVCAATWTHNVVNHEAR